MMGIDIYDVPWVLPLAFLVLCTLFLIPDTIRQQSDAIADRRLIALQHIEMSDPEGVQCGHHDELVEQVRKDSKRRYERELRRVKRR